MTKYLLYAFSAVRKQRSKVNGCSTLDEWSDTQIFYSDTAIKLAVDFILYLQAGKKAYNENIELGVENLTSWFHSTSYNEVTLLHITASDYKKNHSCTSDVKVHEKMALASGTFHILNIVSAQVIFMQSCFFFLK